MWQGWVKGKVFLSDVLYIQKQGRDTGAGT